MDNVISFGKGTKPLVIIPGLSVRDVADSAAMLPGAFRRFTSEWKVYVIDRPAVIPEGTTNAGLAEEYFKNMTALGITEADVIGISQGGMIAQYLAARHPSAVSKLVLGATLSRCSDTLATRLDHWLELAEEGEWEEVNRDTYAHLFTKAYLERYRDAFERLISSVRPRSQLRLERLIKACKTGGAYEELDRISCPTFVIGAGLDEVVGTEGSRVLADKIGCGLYIFENYGHGVYDECPEFYAKAYEFLCSFPLTGSRSSISSVAKVSGDLTLLALHSASATGSNII